MPFLWRSSTKSRETRAARDLFGTRGARRRFRPRPRAQSVRISTRPARSSPRSTSRRKRHHEQGFEIVLIGHAGHPEVIGTMGQLPAGAVQLIETVADARSFEPRDPARLAYVTQTTLSVDDTAAIVAALKERFPGIAGPRKEDICYATTNRQAAVKAIAAGMRPAARGRRAEQLELAAPGGGGRARRLPARLPDPARERDPWEEFGGIARSASPQAPRRRKCWSTRSSTPSGSATASPWRRSTTARENIAFNVPRELRESGARGLRDTAASEPMAVYTEVADEELNAFIASYDIGELLSYKGIAEGVENTNYLVHTTRGSFILTLYEKRVARDDLPFFLGADGASGEAPASPCPTPVHDRAARAHCASSRPRGGARHLPGRLLGAGARRQEHCAAVGRALGRSCTSPAALQARRANAWGSRLAAALRALRPSRRRDRAGARPRDRGRARHARGALAERSAARRHPRRPFPDNVFFLGEPPVGA